MDEKDKYFLKIVEKTGGFFVPTGLSTLPEIMRVKFWKVKLKITLISLILCLLFEYLMPFYFAWFLGALFYLNLQFLWCRRWTKYINLNKQG